MIEELAHDLRFFHELKRPGCTPTPWSLARVALGSRGVLLVGGHRLVQGCVRVAQESSSSRLRRTALHVAAAVLDRFLAALTQSEIRATTELAPGVYLSDRGNLIIGARSVGRGTIIHHRVTLGRSANGTGTPEVGEQVWIGPDSVIAGPIRVGDGATILPGTVLTRNIPPRTVVQGNPACVVRRDFDNSQLRRTLAIPATAP